MFCNSCGSQLQPGQNVCARCGYRVVGTIHRGRLETHLNVLSILWICYSAMHLIGLIGLLIMHTIFNSWVPPTAPPFVGALLQALAVVLGVTGAVGIAAGVGLMRAEPWARQAAIILGILTLPFGFPFGTALGIYTLWVLLGPASTTEYESLAAIRA